MKTVFLIVAAFFAFGVTGTGDPEHGKNYASLCNMCIIAYMALEIINIIYWKGIGEQYGRYVRQVE